MEIVKTVLLCLIFVNIMISVIYLFDGNSNIGLLEKISEIAADKYAISILGLMIFITGYKDKIISHLTKKKNNAIDLSPIPIIALNPDGAIVDINKSGLHSICASSKGQLHGVLFESLLFETEKKPLIIDALLKKVSLSNIEVNIKRLDSKEIIVNLSISHDNGPKGSHIFINYYEITEHKNLENSLLENQKILEQTIEDRTNEIKTQSEILQKQNKDLDIAKEEEKNANKAKSEFLSNMSHELRTPLNAIIGYSEIIKEEAEKDSQVFTDINKIHDSAKHLLSIINDVLDLSKIESGKMEISLEDVNIAEIIEEIESITESLVLKNNNILKIDVQKDIGYMHSDYVKIKQSLMNLISNACKFTKEGKITLQISQIKENGVDKISFSVIDTGIGMSEESQSHLFQSFKQADSSTTRKYGGSGLGLSITKKFCEILGGKIEVESKENHGTRFTMTLPKTSKEI